VRLIVKGYDSVEAFGGIAKFIPFSPPLIEEDGHREVVDTLKSDWITTGPQTHELSENFAKLLTALRPFAVSSCTAALHLALVIVGVGSGDEVITVSHTFCSTSMSSSNTGATPVLIDVEPDTLNMDPSKLRAAITSKDKGHCSCSLRRSSCRARRESTRLPKNSA